MHMLPLSHSSWQCQCAGEELIGARAYRVIFALISLPLAALALVYFINHRYSGTPLWNLRGVPFVHDAVWLLNFISFYFLYPSTFNILEVRHCCLCTHLTVSNARRMIMVAL